MPRAAREISESGRYHIMLRGINKQNIFENDEDKEKYMSILTEYKEKCGFEIYGFCLMSNHIHLLIKTGAEPLESIFKKTGSKYVYWYNLKYGRCGLDCGRQRTASGIFQRT
ncbi:MAG: transposase, partial [Clostridia bacterium]|nr:transposase [Clostridia bacterium]